jgi:hypothetical protein
MLGRRYTLEMRVSSLAESSRDGGGLGLMGFQE